MSKTIDSGLQVRLKKYCEDLGSQRKAAAAIGTSASKINRYISGTYTGDIAKTEEAFKAFFDLQDAQEMQPSKSSPLRIEREYVATTISEHIYKVIRYCQLERGMMVVHGDAGIGKTKAAAKYVQDNPTTAIYLEVSPTTGTLSRFIRYLANELHVSQSRDQMELVRSIKDKLLGTNKVLIIDEAQHLKYLTLEEIRNWSTPNPITGVPGIGIVLIGNSQVHHRMVGKQEAQFAQQFNRSRNNQYSTAQTQREDIVKMFPALQDRGMKHEIDFLLKISSSTKWALRSAVSIWNDAVNMEDISYNNLKNIAQRMGIGIV